MRVRALLLLAGVLALVLAACGDGPAATPDTGPTATVTPIRGTPTPQPTSAVPELSPRVLWMTVDDAGAGRAIVRALTDVPTRAQLTLFGPEDQANLDVEQPGPDTTLQVLHTFEVPLPQPRVGFNLEVADAQGRGAAAFLERGQPSGFTYWPRAENALPAVTYPGNLAVVVAWTNNHLSSGDAVPGEVVLLQKKAGCTTPQDCLATPVGTFRDDTARLVEGIDTHGVRVTLPDVTHDYQLVITGKFGEKSSLRAFYQLEVKGSDVK